MSCARWEADLALYAGGDLANGAALELETHLAECRKCRQLVADLREGQAVLQESDETMEAAIAAQVHRRVLAEISGAAAGRARMWIGWRWIAAAALVAAVVMAVLLPKAWRVERLAPMVRIHAPKAPGWIEPVVTRIERVPHRTGHARRSRTQVARARQMGEPVMVQLVTDNPNVVIYWIVDGKPQGD